MDDQVLFFFDQMPEALPLYETFEKKLCILCKGKKSEGPSSGLYRDYVWNREKDRITPD